MKNKKTITIIVIIILISMAIAYMYNINYTTRGYIGLTINKLEGKTLNKNFNVKIKSGNLCTDYNVSTVLNDIYKFKLNTINVPVAINIKDTASSNMQIDNANKKKAIELLKHLKGKNINIILEPYPWIENGSKPETELNPENVNEFFYNWENNVLKPLIDDIAVPYHVDALVIGTSFTKIERNEDQLCNVADFVRKYYKGLITYRTSFWVTADWNDPSTKKLQDKLQKKYQQKLNNKLFSKIDFISIAAYFELTDNDTNTKDNLVKAISSSQRYGRKQNIKKEIENFYTRWHKPIFFGELGFPKTDKASVEPWNPYLTSIVNSQEQANCFEAYREAFKNEPWFLGFSVFSIGNSDKNHKYYPGKESTEIIKNWYKK